MSVYRLNLRKKKIIGLSKKINLNYEKIIKKINEKTLKFFDVRNIYKLS